jgi:hypothetical protein
LKPKLKYKNGGEQMSVFRYLDVNGAVKCEKRLDRRFILPDKTNVSRSLRFGAHAFALNATMQILPVGNYERVRFPREESGGQAQKIIKTIINGCNVRSLLM